MGSKHVFLKAFHLILMHVIHKIQCFEEFLHYFALFFKKLFFPEFRPIKIMIKNVCESLSVSIGARLVLDQSKHFGPIEFVFQSIENRVENFLKTEFHVFKLTFSKVFNIFSLSIRLNQGSNPIFCCFPPFVLQGLSQGQ